MVAEEETGLNTRNQALDLCPPSLILPRSLPEYVVSLKDVIWRQMNLFVLVGKIAWKGTAISVEPSILIGLSYMFILRKSGRADDQVNSLRLRQI